MLIHNNNALCNEIDELRKERDELKKELWKNSIIQKRPFLKIETIFV